MTKDGEKVRVQLGPAALELLKESDLPNAKALDHAINSLQQKAKSSRGCALSEPQITALLKDLKALRKDVQDMRKAFHDLRDLTLAELRMTRLLVGSLMSTSDGEQMALMRFGKGLIAKMCETSDLLKQSDLDELERQEELFQRLNRMELDRAPEVQKEAELEKEDDLDEELER